MNRLILAGVAVLGCLTVACAQSAGTPALDNRSAAWKQNLALAVNDPTKVAGVMQSIPEADRAAFAADVLEVLQTKRQYMPDKAAWAQEFSATAAALIAGAGGAKNAVLSTVSAEIVNACVTGESHELASGDLAQLGILEKSTMLQLQGDDRVASYLRFDTYVQSDLGRWLPWKESRFGLRGQLRVNNVLGAGFPRYVNGGSGAGVQPYGDWRGRTYSLSLTATF